MISTLVDLSADLAAHDVDSETTVTSDEKDDDNCGEYHMPVSMTQAKESIHF